MSTLDVNKSYCTVCGILCYTWGTDAVSALDVNKSQPTICGILCYTQGTDAVSALDVNKSYLMWNPLLHMGH